MTTNQTIDGVPRDSVSQLVDFLADAKAYHKVVIGRCEDCIKSGESSEREEYGRIGYRTEKIEQVERLADELRALLDAPAVQWLAMEVNGKPATSRAPTDSMHIDDRVKMAANAKRYEWLRDRNRVTDIDTALCVARDDTVFFGHDLDMNVDDEMRLARLEELHPCAD